MYLKNALRAATALTLVTAGAALADGHAGNPYAPYEGTTLIVNFPAHPHYNAVMEVLPEFTAQTGIEVEVDMLPYLDMRERQTLELALDEGAYDLISYVVFSKADFATEQDVLDAASRSSGSIEIDSGSATVTLQGVRSIDADDFVLV